MPSTSVLIPSRSERFLTQTIGDILRNAGGDIEVIAVLDGGKWPDGMYGDPRVKYIHWGTESPEFGFGMRAGLNAACAVAKGEFVMKLDAHCMVSKDFDLRLAEVCEPDWVCVPTRKRLDAENWCLDVDGRPDINYQYIDLSNDGLNGKQWHQKNKNRELDRDLVVDMISCQGSCYFMHKSHWEKMGFLNVDLYGTFRKDPQEVIFTTWTSGGRCVRVKTCWYAHLHKGTRYGRMYHLDKADYRFGDEQVKEWWKDEPWGKRRKLPLRYIFRKHFSDMPGWGDHPWMQGTETQALLCVDPVISICIPAMNRTEDLKEIMPGLIEVANACPPVEIVILDYNSSDGLGEYVGSVQASVELKYGSSISYRRYEGSQYYQMAHARNLSVLASVGEYVLISSTDIRISEKYLKAIRAYVANGLDSYRWIRPRDSFVGCICVKREEFIAAGGFDERFVGYGKEDKDLRDRLLRRGLNPYTFPESGLSLIYTPWPKKVANYDPALGGRRGMHKRSLAVYEENCAVSALVANSDGWGSWD